MKLQVVLMVITGLMFNNSTHTSSIKDDQAPVDRTEIYQRGDKTQQKFDIRQAAFAALVASKKPSAKQELLDVLDKKKSKKDARTVKPCKHPRQLIPQPYPSEPLPLVLNSEKYDPYAKKEVHWYYQWNNYDCGLVRAVLNGTITDPRISYDPVTQDNIHTYCWPCGAHAVAVITEDHIVNLVHVSPEMIHAYNAYIKNRIKKLKHFTKSYVLSSQYYPFTQWKRHDPHSTCTTYQVENGTYQDPLSVQLCECHACENQRPDEDNFYWDEQIKYLQLAAQHYVKQQKHYHKNASLKENVQALHKRFLEKDRQAQVEEIIKEYKPKTRPVTRTIRVFDPQRFDFSEPTRYVASTWHEQPDEYDRAKENTIRRKIQFFNKLLLAKEQEKKEQEKAAPMHARDFLSQEELDNYQLTPKEKIRPLISQKDRDTAVEETVAEWCPLLPRIVPDLVNPLDAEEDYFKDHKNQIF